MFHVNKLYSMWNKYDQNHSTVQGTTDRSSIQFYQQIREVSYSGEFVQFAITWIPATKIKRLDGIFRRYPAI